MKKQYCLLLSLLISCCILYPSWAQQGKQNIAVLDLDPTGISKNEAQFLSDRFRTELFETGRFQVVEREKMNVILDEQGFQQSGCTSVECAVEVGQLLNVGTIAAGTIGKIEEIYSISIRLIDVQSGAIVRTATRDYEGRLSDVLTDVIPELADELAGYVVTEETDSPLKHEVTGETREDEEVLKKYAVKAKIGFASLQYTAELNRQIDDLPGANRDLVNDYANHLFIGLEGTYLLSRHWQLKLGLAFENMFTPWELNAVNYTSQSNELYQQIEIKRENRFANIYLGMNYLIWSKLNHYNFYLGADIGLTSFTSKITQYYFLTMPIPGEDDSSYEYTHFTWKVALGGNYYITSSLSLGIELIAQIIAPFDTEDQTILQEFPPEFSSVVFPADGINASGLVLNISVGYHF
jgi:TolB-like protein